MIMHYYKNKVIIVLGILLYMAGSTGCKKGWLDVNYNPQDLTDQNVTVDVLLPPMLERCAVTPDNWSLEHWMGYWSHWSMNPNFPLVTYRRMQVDGGDIPDLSATPAPEIPYLEIKSRQTNQLYYAGIAKVIRALQWSRSVDLINNMPYTDAYNGNILQPRYDDGRFIYEDLMKQLDSAIILIKAATDFQSLRIANADIMFGGDKTKWVRFINTLKLRLLIHQANRADRQSYIAQEIQKITTEGSGFLQSGEDAAINPGYSIANRKYSRYFGYFSNHNQLYGGGFYNAVAQFGSQEIAHANYYVLELLKADEDPRIGLFFSTVDNPLPAGAPEPFTQSDPQDYRGNKLGLYNNFIDYPYQGSLYVSAVGGSRNAVVVSPTAKGIIKGIDMPDWIMTSIESFFLQAEAIQRGWLPGDAEQAYKNAVMESFRWLNAGGNATVPSFSDDIFNTWYNAQVVASNPKISWAAAPDKYKLLMYQKYMAFNGIEPMETWTDYRRNGRFPDVPVSLAPARVSDLVPVRLLYNENEYLVNADNVNAQGQIDMFTGRIWWMP